MTRGDRPDGHTEAHQPNPTSPADPVGTTGATADSLAYPISPDYVKSWTPVRALCELIANALDEDPDATVAWADGVLTITDDGPGIPEEGMILGHSTKTAAQIGQFGEGKKLACLVLARSPEIGAVRCETIGYGFVPTVQRRRLLEGLIPSLSGQGAEVLVYQLHRNNRTHGTVFTVACTQALAEEAISRFRALTEPGYTPPAAPGTCVLTGAPGRVWIGGVLVSTTPGLLASYDLPLDDKGLQNRDRTVIEAGALRDAVRAILSASDDPQVVSRFATHVLAGGKLREPEQFFTDVSYNGQARPRAAWRAWARTHLPAKAFYAGSRQEESVLDLQDMDYTLVTAKGLPGHQESSLMSLLGVEVARVRQQRHYERNHDKTTWVPDTDLSTAERDLLSTAKALVCRAVGPFALDRVRVYSASDESPCADGFYTPRNGDVAIHRDVLADQHRTLAVLFHEAAHRVAHRGGGRWVSTPDYSDRSRGFEHMLTEFGGLLLGLLAHVADGGTLPEPATTPPTPGNRRVRLTSADDPAVPVSRRELAHLLIDRLPRALTARGFTDERDLVASTAVRPVYWNLLIRPRPAGFRRQQGVSTAWDYDKVALLAEAVGIHPPVAWLASNLSEGPLHGRRREQWGQPGRWAKKVRDQVDRACTDLEILGGDYAAQIPAVRALADGTTPTPTGDDSWQAPARALIVLERRRLRLDADDQADDQAC